MKTEKYKLRKEAVCKPELYTVLPAVYGSIKEAVNDLKLNKRVKWKVWNGELCRCTKKSICPEYVVKNGTPVQINCR